MKTAWQSLLYIRCRKRKKDKTLESLMKEENKLLTFDRAGFMEWQKSGLPEERKQMLPV